MGLRRETGNECVCGAASPAAHLRHIPGTTLLQVRSKTHTHRILKSNHTPRLAGVDETRQQHGKHTARKQLQQWQTLRKLRFEAKTHQKDPDADCGAQKREVRSGKHHLTLFKNRAKIATRVLMTWTILTLNSHANQLPSPEEDLPRGQPRTRTRTRKGDSQAPTQHICIEANSSTQSYNGSAAAQSIQSPPKMPHSAGTQSYNLYPLSTPTTPTTLQTLHKSNQRLHPPNITIQSTLYKC